MVSGAGRQGGEADGGLQHRGCQPHTCELGNTKVPHDGGVRQQEEWFSHQRAEGRDGKAENLAGMARCAGHGSGLSGHAASLMVTGDSEPRGMRKATVRQN